MGLLIPTPRAPRKKKSLEYLAESKQKSEKVVCSSLVERKIKKQEKGFRKVGRRNWAGTLKVRGSISTTTRRRKSL